MNQEQKEIKKEIPLLTPEEIALRAGLELPRLILLDKNDFAERAIRFRQLAANHSLRDYLLLLAILCDAQDKCFKNNYKVPLSKIDPSFWRSDNIAPENLPLEKIWLDFFKEILNSAIEKIDNEVLKRVKDISDEDLTLQAEKIITKQMRGVDMAAALIISAALQVYYAILISKVAKDNTPQPLETIFNVTEDTPQCPCCGSLPTSSITKIEGNFAGYRYAHCSLCQTQWHIVRVKCTHCMGTEKIEYRALEIPNNEMGNKNQNQTPAEKQKKPAVQAETCGICNNYLKILYKTADPQVDAIADDIASISLDLLLGEENIERHGANLLLLMGQ